MREKEPFQTPRRGDTKSLDENFKVTDRSTTSSDQGNAKESEIPAEALSHKGYSSTAVQNIHAVASLPHNLDGADDSRRRAVLSALTAASKTRSPRLAQRSTPAGITWYGPHCRQVLERSAEEGGKHASKE